MNYLGIDWGEKRIGLAFGDATMGVATPLEPAISPHQKKRYQQIKRVISDRNIKAIVIGYPFNMDGSIGFKAQEVDHFIKSFLEMLHLPIHRFDERLTSHYAQSFGTPKKMLTKKQTIAQRRSGKLDSQAATIILQDFFEHPH